MKSVQYLLNGQYLSTAYDFYASKASHDFGTMDPNMVGTSMASASNIYCAQLAIDGSFNLYMGRLPDRLWGLVWRTPSSSDGLSVTRTGVKPQVIYTLVLDDSGVLSAQSSGTTFWKSPGPSDTSAGSYFAQITDGGALTLSTGTPSNPGSQYWSSGSDQCVADIQFVDSLNMVVGLQVTYYDARNGKPGSSVKTDLGSVNGSTTKQWPGMLAEPSDANYLKALPAAMTLTVDPGANCSSPSNWACAGE